MSMRKKNPSRSSVKPGTFGARQCRLKRRAFFELGVEALPPSWRKAWLIQRIVATPEWVDMAEIRKVYIEAQRLTEETGIPHQVDHEVPLMHPAVCGLHVPWNLRAIPKAVNAAKSNTWNPDQLALFEL